MPYVNYIREHVAFIEYAGDNGLSGNERLLWYALMHIMNQRAQGANYPDGFIRIANKRLLSYAPMQFDAMAKARNALQQRGLIEFVHGKRNAELPMYKMNYFSCPADNPQDTQHPVDNPSSVPAVCPSKTDNIRGNNRGNMQGNTQGNASGNVGDIYNKPNVYPNRNPYLREEEHDLAAGLLRARERLHDEYREYRESDIGIAQQEASIAADKAYRAYFGKQPSSAFVQRMGTVAAQLGMSPDMVGIAIHDAALRNANDVYAYAVSLMNDWKYQAVTTPDEYAEYSFTRDCINGKFGVRETGDYETMQQQREARMKKHEAAKGGGFDGGDSEEDI